MIESSLRVNEREADVTLRAREAAFAVEVESWLRSTVAAPAVTWSPRGNGLIAVRSVAEVAERVNALLTAGSWAVVRRTHAPQWAQCMRVDGGWIVEVNGIPGPDCFARRVQVERRRPRGIRKSSRGRRRVHDAGRLMADYLNDDVMMRPAMVAEIIWTWLRASALPDGYALRDL